MSASRTAYTIAVGEELPSQVIRLTTSRIVAGAIATGDFEPIHHDRSAAQRAGRSDVFMNIYSINGLMQRCATDWAGPAARILSMKLTLGGPCVAGDILTIGGKVIGRAPAPAPNGQFEIELTATTGLGHAARARIVMTLEPPSARPD
jgi:acyl dehydratase